MMSLETTICTFKLFQTKNTNYYFNSATSLIMLKPNTLPMCIHGKINLMLNLLALLPWKPNKGRMPAMLSANTLIVNTTCLNCSGRGGLWPFPSVTFLVPCWNSCTLGPVDSCKSYWFLHETCNFWTRVVPILSSCGLDPLSLNCHLGKGADNCPWACCQTARGILGKTHEKLHGWFTGFPTLSFWPKARPQVPYWVVRV